MKASDYIVEYLIGKGITDVFGYPGGMVTHLMDSFSKYQGQIAAHVTYHEQGAAFAACGYAQTSGKVGVAYATSGPGATNLITGICNAFFDSIPTLFITGQVNTFEAKNEMPVRQRGFQETDIVSMVKGVTKYAAKVDNADGLKWQLDFAFAQAQSGRKGPVLLDIPMDILHAEIDADQVSVYEASEIHESTLDESRIAQIREALKQAKRPVILLGNGIKMANAVADARKVIAKLGIPTVSTMISMDIVNESALNYGFIGAYGDRAANFIVAKSDLLLSLGARLDVRQVGAKRENFAPNATLIRVEVDEGELAYRVHDNEVAICADVSAVLRVLNDIWDNILLDYSEWLEICSTIRFMLAGMDKRLPNEIVEQISEHIPSNAVITADVGQNQIWVAQSLRVKERQKVVFSGGHGAMGYSLPAAIGCYYASHGTVVSFNGDGGIQMNIQELQTIARERLPIKIVLMNNSALGMIRHFQEMYFGENYVQTVATGGYTVPDFGAIAKAYGIEYYKIESADDVRASLFEGVAPCLIEVSIKENTYVFPKLEFGKPNQDQEPLMDRALFNYLSSL